MANKARSAELAIIISYPTSPSGIIVLLKTTTKFRENLATFYFAKSSLGPRIDFLRPPLFLFAEESFRIPAVVLTRTLTILVGHGIMAHN